MNLADQFPLLTRFDGFWDREAIISGKTTETYSDLMCRVRGGMLKARAYGAAMMDLATLEGQLGPDLIATFCVLYAYKDVIILGGESQYRIVRDGDMAILAPLAERGHAGVVLFTSGTSGHPKAVAHDLDVLIASILAHRRPAYRTLAMLPFDHIGGLNTVLRTLANGGTLIIPPARDPETVCATIARHRVELLPTSPSFCTWLFASEAHRRHDLSSLRIITYGSEPMPTTTLAKLHAAFPQVSLRQTYGLSEVGILQAKSREDGSLWMRVGGEGYETRVVDGRLHIRAQTAMLGYLNAPSPFDAEGWLDTHDLVEQDGEWLRIIGRDSDVIAVGGHKVHPSEVEAVLAGMPGVRDCVVYGVEDAFLGQVVGATVDWPDPTTEARRYLRTYCAMRLPMYAVPVRITIGPVTVSERGKKMRGCG